MSSTRKNNVIRGIGLAFLSAAAPGAIGASSGEPELAVQQIWNLGGPGGWDYLSLDSSGRRLFVTRSTRVDVVSTETGNVIGTIPGTEGVHGVALAEDLKRGYTSNGKGDSVTVFDLDTLKTIKEVKIPGHNPDAILYEPSRKHIFTFDGKSKDVTVIAADTLQIVATLPVPDKPEFAADDGAGQIYVNIESDPGQMVVIDSRALSVKATWPLAGCASPSGLAIDRTHHRLFSVCDGKIMVVTDAQTGKQVARVAIGEGPDAAAYDAKRGLVFSSNGEGTLTVVRQDGPDTYRATNIFATQKGARTMALDAASGKIYLATAKFGAPPPATPDQPHPRPSLIPDSFTILVVGARTAGH
jgi:DNA-binding beta-propeller fold protein YncE